MDHRAKLAWASKHLEKLDKAIGEFFDGDAYHATEQYDPTEGGYVARIYIDKDIPPDWSLMVGDIVHNLRSSLDALAYVLTVSHSGAPTEQEARSIQFLLVDSKAEFNDPKRRRCISRMSSQAQTVVEQLQPFNRKPAGFKHQLSVLRDLSNIDKHRHILLAQAAAERSSVGLRGVGIKPGTEVQGISGPLTNGAIVAKWRFDMQPTTKVHMHMNMTIVITFADGPAKGGSLVPFLTKAHDMIRDDYFPPLEALL